MTFIFRSKPDKPTGQAVSNFKQSPAKPDGYIVSCSLARNIHKKCGIIPANGSLMPLIVI